MNAGNLIRVIYSSDKLIPTCCSMPVTWSVGGHGSTLRSKALSISAGKNFWARNTRGGNFTADNRGAFLAVLPLGSDYEPYPDHQPCKPGPARTLLKFRPDYKNLCNYGNLAATELRSVLIRKFH